jgi:hypothetical protein
VRWQGPGIQCYFTITLRTRRMRSALRLRYVYYYHSTSILQVLPPSAHRPAGASLRLTQRLKLRYYPSGCRALFGQLLHVHSGTLLLVTPLTRLTGPPMEITLFYFIKLLSSYCQATVNLKQLSETPT